MKKDQLFFSPDVKPVKSSAMCVATLLAIFASSVARGDSAHDTRAQKLLYTIVATHPHDARAFTQGLAYHDGVLIESAGGFGRSFIAARGVADGTPIRRRTLAGEHFAEGAAVVSDRVFQLTWRSGIALVYDLALEPRGRFAYEGEGWGLAFDGRWLIMSDGSATLQFREPKTFALQRRLAVRDDGQPVRLLNELEHARGLIFANVWRTDRIAAIDPGSGRVTGWLDLGELKDRFPKPIGWSPQEHVLNGIAFNPDNGHFYVTGKCWPALFEIDIRESSQRNAVPTPRQDAASRSPSN